MPSLRVMKKAELARVIQRFRSILAFARAILDFDPHDTNRRHPNRDRVAAFKFSGPTLRAREIDHHRRREFMATFGALTSEHKGSHTRDNLPTTTSERSWSDNIQHHLKMAVDGVWLLKIPRTRIQATQQWAQVE